MTGRLEVLFLTQSVHTVVVFLAQTLHPPCLTLCGPEFDKAQLKSNAFAFAKLYSNKKWSISLQNHVTYGNLLVCSLKIQNSKLNS